MNSLRPLVALVAVLISTVSVLGNVSPFERKLAAERQIAHILNRLTYGLQPGDVELVRRTGTTKWIRQQLHPEQIAENPLLDARLERVPTLRLSTWQIFERYQPQQAPTLPTLAQLLTTDQQRRLLNGSPDDKRAVINSLAPELRMQVLGTATPQSLESVPEFKDEAIRARSAAQQTLAELRRRQRPPLADLLTTEQQNVLLRGAVDDKIRLLTSLDAEKRAQVLRQAPAQAVPDEFQREALALRQPQQVPTAEAIESRLLRARYSNRQLQEVLVDFWMNHFNVFTEKGSVRQMITSYERDAIRPHVLGRFRDMLLATARHPAMLFYLDNWQSRAAPDATTLPAQARAPTLNENYGRELMELHTLGVDGGYTQADVVAVARCFTGWTIFDPNRYGEFQFNPANHDRGEKTVLGHIIPRGGGEEDGVKVIDILARHPSTARFISRKLAQRFVADDPPQALVEAMAATFTQTDGDLLAVMETLLTSRAFMSEGAWQAKIKSPLEMVMSSLRALNVEVTETTMLTQRLAELGQPMYGKSEPTGYPNTGDVWASSAGLLGRIRFANALTAGQIKGVTVPPDLLPAGGVKPALAAVLGVDPSDESVAAIEKSLDAQPLTPMSLATVIIASPDFQRR